MSTRRPRERRLIVLLVAAFVMGLVPPVQAGMENDLSPEGDVSSFLTWKPKDKDDEGINFAVLPQLGFGPETGPKAGVKFEGRDLFGGHTFADLNLLYALQLQQKAELVLGAPQFGGDGRFMLFGTLAYKRDPAMEFFGIGNNDVGPTPLSNHDIRRGRVGLTLGYRLMRHLAVAMTAFYRETDVKPGNDGDQPSTTRFAPDLPGIGGARSNYLALAFVYSSRDEVVRPTKGWEATLKFLSADRAFFNDDADFHKLIGDVSYIVPLGWRRQLIALRANGEAIFGDEEDIPFFELSHLGGDDTMRGYFPQRFLGKGRLLLNAEYRLKLVDFNFRDIWDITIDGVGFGDAGRVYEDDEDFTRHFASRIRLSYGGGVRIGFHTGLVARIDVGFSPEETGLVYLTFGHIF